jgi:exosortase/archaeosortase family protein
MRFVATLTVQALDLQGIPAFQQGNLIQVTAGLVGVDEACSGVRSLQTSLFVALYLGENHRLRPLRRVLLVAAGFAIAIAANTGRTWFLTWLAATRDLTTMNAWHDTAGLVVLFVVLAGLWLLVCRVPASPTDWKARSIPGSRPVTVVAGLSMLAWLAALGGITELWYRAHETAATQQSQWTMLFPEKASAFRDIEISEKATALLRQTEGRAAGWTDPEGNDWQVFFLRWAPGCNSAQLAKGHRPEICLPGTGFRLTEQMEETMFRIGARELPVRQYVFEMRGQTLHVFYCNWEDRVLPADRLLSSDGSHGSRLQAVWLGRRNLGQRVLEVMIRGPGSPQQAAEILASGLAPLLREEQSPAS